jgi:hypothetical protein
MTCRSCGAQIADKAIVCYRCGTPTADLASVPLKPMPRRNWPPAILMLVIVALGAWLIPKTPPGSIERIAAWVATWIIVFAVVAWVKRRRRRR